MKKDQPLVSVVVLTYNSVTTVLETLDSIKNQTYRNIELIITDDCSKDDTVAVCEEWIEENKSFFQRVQLITSDVNTGVCANGNRGCFAAIGEWLKIIAGDDILLLNCIEDFVDFANNNPEVSFITSFAKIYKNTFIEENCTKECAAHYNLSIFEKDCSEQLQLMYCIDYLIAPACIVKRDVFNILGGYNERYVHEDHPFYINLLEHGYRIYFMPKSTVGYRIHESTYNSSQRLFNYDFIKKTRLFRKEKCFKYYSFKQRLSVYFKWKCEDFIVMLGLNKKNKIMRKIYKMVDYISYKGLLSI